MFLKNHLFVIYLPVKLIPNVVGYSCPTACVIGVAVIVLYVPIAREKNELIVCSLFIAVDGVSGEGIDRVCDGSVCCDNGNVGVRHEFIRGLKALAVEILNEKQGEIVCHIVAIAAEFNGELGSLIEIIAVIGNEDYFGVIINTVLAEIIEPFAELNERCRIGLIMNELFLGGYALSMIASLLFLRKIMN